MLNLKAVTPPGWLADVERHLDEVLIDHAHCEKKAAGTAMNLIFAYVEDEVLVRILSGIVTEELEHLEMVLDILRRRGTKFRRLTPSPYGRRLNELVRKHDPQRAVDRLLIAALIEARSCERFALLRDHLGDRELAGFYGSLFASEARHHSTYVQLAAHFAPEPEVRARLDELAERETEIIRGTDYPVRMHS